MKIVKKQKNKLALLSEEHFCRFTDFEEETATLSGHISDCSTLSLSLSRPAELASELQWPLHPNLDTLPSFFFIGLFKDSGSHPYSAVRQHIVHTRRP